MFISSSPDSSKPCPCGSKKLFSQCCGVYLQGGVPAPTAEKLMRSRYSAYYFKNIDYLVNTEHPRYSKPNSRATITATANSVNWLGLTIVSTKAGKAKHDKGTVEFIALYQEGKSVGQLHERSYFVKEKGKWFYTYGDMLPPIKPKKK